MYVQQIDQFTSIKKEMVFQLISLSSAIEVIQNLEPH